MKKVLIKGKGICKTFSGDTDVVQVLDHVDIDIFEGDFTVIMGASGAGKSTLLYALSGMDSITGGEVEFKGEKISNLPENKMARLRAEGFGFVFQQTHLVSNLTLLENVAVAGYACRTKAVKDVRERAVHLLSQMYVDGAKDRLPHQVSGVLSPISRNNTAFWRAAARQEIYMEFLKNPPEQGSGQPVTCSTSGMGLRLK